jgi:RLL motif-containing protein 1
VILSEHAMAVPSDLTAAGSSPGLVQALKVLRLLHVQDLREIQDRVNGAIESIQQLTANPKTDTRLGKVGR